jgi:hypothetical protein
MEYRNFVAVPDSCPAEIRAVIATKRTGRQFTAAEFDDGRAQALAIVRVHALKSA